VSLLSLSFPPFPFFDRHPLTLSAALVYSAHHCFRYRFFGAVYRAPGFAATPYLPTPFTTLNIPWFVGNDILIRSSLFRRVGLKVTTARETLKKCGITAATA
jgi:hypothetical protein